MKYKDEQFIKELDQKAEDCNLHEFVGLHKKLFKMLIKTEYVGYEGALSTLRAIRRRGGLHVMAVGRR